MASGQNPDTGTDPGDQVRRPAAMGAKWTHSTVAAALPKGFRGELR